MLYRFKFLLQANIHLFNRLVSFFQLLVLSLQLVYDFDMFSLRAIDFPFLDSYLVLQLVNQFLFLRLIADLQL